MLAGQQPDAGELRVGDTVAVAYVDQSRDALGDDNTVWQEISGGVDLLNIEGFEVHSRSYVGRFNFKGSDQEKRVGQLSGGERNRVHLAKLLVSGANPLMLDEPTNDLDVETPHWSRHCSTSRVVRWSSRTIAGFWIALRRTSWRLKGIASVYGLRATSRTTK